MNFPPKMRDAFTLWYIRLDTKHTSRQAKKIIKQFKLPSDDKRRFTHEKLDYLINLLKAFLSDVMIATNIDTDWHDLLTTEIRHLTLNIDLRSPISYKSQHMAGV